MRHFLRTAFSIVVFFAGASVVPAAGRFQDPPKQDGSAKQDMKDAGKDTKKAAKDAGKGTKTAAKKTGTATKNTAEKAVNKTAAKTGEGAERVKDKTKPD